MEDTLHQFIEPLSENLSKPVCDNVQNLPESFSSDDSNVNEGVTTDYDPQNLPVLGLIDDEDVLVLPPEDTPELGERDEDQIIAFNDLVRRPGSNSLETPSDVSSVNNIESEANLYSCLKKKKKKKQYTINLSNCKYESVRRVARRFGFREVEEDDEDWNLYWTDYSVSLDRVFVMKTWQKINHFPGMSELCRKDSLARNLNRMSKAFPKDYAIFPKTWCLPSEWNELQNYARKKKSRTYIFKPDTGCQGRGIYITRTVKDVRPLENMICQVYITKPLLIDGYKFDMRLYVLLTSCDPLRMYMFRDGLVRFTTVPYSEPSQRNMHNMYMHLTNYAVQKHSHGYVRDDEEGGTKRRVTTLNRWFIQNGYDLQKIWSDVDDVVIKTVLSGYGVLRHNYRTCFPNHVQASACFEILGFDIMFNNKLKPFVLEVNHSPSFNTDSKLDKEIKEAMLWDTLQLAQFGMLSKKKCMEDERKRIRTRLLQKTAKKEIRETIEREVARSLASAEKYESSHMGNFRLIYPCATKDKYEPFLNPNASFYQETMTYKVRSECARQMREEIRVKQEKLGALQNKQRALGPESPAPKKLAVKFHFNRPPANRTPTAAPRVYSSKRAPSVQQPWGDQSSVPYPVTAPLTSQQTDDRQSSWEPIPILPDEEDARLETLRQRERFMRTIGLVEAVHRLLANSPGVMSTIDHIGSTQHMLRLKKDSIENSCERNDRHRDTPSLTQALPVQFHRDLMKSQSASRMPSWQTATKAIPSQTIGLEFITSFSHGRQHGKLDPSRLNQSFSRPEPSSFIGHRAASGDNRGKAASPLRHNSANQLPTKSAIWNSLNRPKKILKSINITKNNSDSRQSSSQAIQRVFCRGLASPLPTTLRVNEHGQIEIQRLTGAYSAGLVDRRKETRDTIQEVLIKPLLSGSRLSAAHKFNPIAVDRSNNNVEPLEPIFSMPYRHFNSTMLKSDASPMWYENTNDGLDGTPQIRSAGETSKSRALSHISQPQPQIRPNCTPTLAYHQPTLSKSTPHIEVTEVQEQFTPNRIIH
ncbi:hypothetical protein PHET_02776 [Paragonimus heterotremus]|uniref:Tubulin polyglutamylase TTLL6 n=1 Tax=Paragonimus heterotremus TaxID=100268 RepID=A0A8J4TCP8_9TREM|nr:hypothetical protein PHET_02776 [Paragonimus heterotremus]